MKKLFLLLLCCLLPVAALAEFSLASITTEDGLILTYFVTPQPDAGGDTAELLIQGYCMDERWEDAYALNLLLADAGDTEAMIRLGRHHAGGFGVPQDDSAALTWYQRAVEAGSPYAPYDLALAYLNGWGVAANRETAIALLTDLAADEELRPVNTWAQNALTALADPEAPLPQNLTTRPLPYRNELLADDAMQLGYFWRDGEGGIIDHQEAARWFEKAIALEERGLAAEWSHAALAEYYRDGTLGFYDIDKAIAHAQYLYDPWTFSGDIYFYGVTAEDGTVILAPDVEKGVEYYLQGAEYGKAESLDFVADFYYTGEYLPQDIDKAIELYLTGMQLGSAHCAQMVEGFYAEGRLYAPEMLRRLAWTAANGNPAPEADSFLLAFALDLIYGKTDADGAVLVEANQYQYAFWVLRHLGQYSYVEDVSVHNWLGWFYCGNAPEVCEADYRFAHSHYAQAADLGSGYACAQLGILYRDGKGVDVDAEKARSCFQHAIELGYTQAQQYLDAMTTP